MYIHICNYLYQVKGDRYIFIYGGSDKWTREFTAAVDKNKRHDIHNKEGRCNNRLLPFRNIGLTNYTNLYLIIFL